MAERGARVKTAWLSDDEQRAWRGFLRLHARLNVALGQELTDRSGLSTQDYGVLVVLTDHPDGRARPSELGRELGWEKSRLSHHLRRMEERGLVRRQRCPTDQRGWLLSITPRGRRAIESAAPDHVAAVRRSFIDLLTPTQVRGLADLTEQVLAAWDPCEGDDA